MDVVELGTDHVFVVLYGVQAFRILDPKGVLLEALSEPVKEVGFLVRCVW